MEIDISGPDPHYINLIPECIVGTVKQTIEYKFKNLTLLIDHDQLGNVVGIEIVK